MLRSPEVQVWAAVLLGSTFGAVGCALRALIGAPLLASAVIVVMFLLNVLMASYFAVAFMFGGADDMAMWVLF